MHDVDQRLTKDVDRLCSDLAELIPTMVSICTQCKHWQHPVKHCFSVCAGTAGSVDMRSVTDL